MKNSYSQSRNGHVKILFKHDSFEGGGLEGAWALPAEDGYILDNILFYAKEFSLGDRIKVISENEELFASDLLEESGHSTIRILFASADLVSQTRSELKEMGCPSELSNYEKLIAVDIPPNIEFSKIKEYLETGEEKGDWEYQEACISSTHSSE